MSSDSTRSLGREGEKLAVKRIKRLGYRVLGRNVTYPFGELDLVALDGDELVFIEVKTGLESKAIDPAEHVSEAKRRRVRRAAEHYMMQRKAEHLPARFDVISIILPDEGAPVIEHIRSAF